MLQGAQKNLLFFSEFQKGRMKGKNRAILGLEMENIQ